MPQPTKASSYTDDQLLVAVQANNSDARDLLFERFHHRVRAVVARRCPIRARRQPDFVDDVVNQTFTFVLDPTLSRFNPRRGSAPQYLFGLTCNAIRMITRQRRAACADLDNQSRFEVANAARTAGVIYRNVVSVRSVPVPGLDLEARDEVRRVLDGGDRETSRWVKEHFFGGETFVGIAARMGVSHTTVSRKITGFLMANARKLA